MSSKRIRDPLYGFIELPLPVFERRVQQDLLVQQDSGKEAPVAEYLGFKISDEDVLEKGDTYLHIFIRPYSSIRHDELRLKIDNVLHRFEA